MVDLIPKETPKTSKALNFFFYFSIGLLVLAIVGYIVLYVFLNRNQNELDSLRTEIDQIMTEDRQELEEEMLAVRGKVNKFSSLTGRRAVSRPFFEIIEQAAHPEAWFNNFSFKVEQFEVNLAGETKSFVTLWQQVLIFKQEKAISNVNLVNFSINEKGLISFDLALSFKPLSPPSSDEQLSILR